MNTVKDALEALGRDSVAMRLGATPSAISNAISANQFPASWYVVIQAIAGQKKISVPDGLFNMKCDAGQAAE